jgi:hypothetical protein
VEERLASVDGTGAEAIRLHGMVSHLHLIRTVLLDPQSPLEPFISDSADVAKGVRHAT